MSLEGVKDLNTLGGYERMQNHMAKAHGVGKQEYAALAPLINSFTKQLLYEICKDELR